MTKLAIIAGRLFESFEDVDAEVQFIEEYICDAVYARLLSHPSVLAAQAETNMTDFDLSDYSLDQVVYTQFPIRAQLAFSTSSQIPRKKDCVFTGDTVDGTADVLVDAEGAVTFENVECHVALINSNCEGTGI